MHGLPKIRAVWCSQMGRCLRLVVRMRDGRFNVPCASKIGGWSFDWVLEQTIDNDLDTTIGEEIRLGCLAV